MKKLYFLSLLFLLVCVPGSGQVKSSFLYSTTMPYGTLDIRTTVSSTSYYYLREGQTFSYRESSPGVRTNSYKDMTSWESNPYLQGHLRYKSGTSDKFVMNYRLLKPINYSASYSAGYPLIVIMHGGVERGNCYYNSCYHGTWDYDPNVNSPRASTSSTNNLLNNDHSLSIGGKQHLDARNLAGTRLPHDPTMPSRAFPGFVLVPQMLNDWDTKSVEDLIRIVQLHVKQYKIDPNRIYIHGLSVGGYAVYEALKRGSWLFAAAMPMCATRDAGIFTHNQQSRVVNIPIWVFQGGKDPNPTPATTKALLDKWRAAGGTPTYTEYADLGHAIWNRAYSEATFFTWLLTKNKANLHVHRGNKVIVRSTGTYPKLYMPQGFFAYQWQKDGVNLSSTSYYISVTSPGTYRGRFSRVANPTSTQWNKWSSSVRITEGTAPSSIEDEVIVVADSLFEEKTLAVYPNPAPADNLNLEYNGDRPVRIRMIDAMGRPIYTTTIDDPNAADAHRLENIPQVPDGLYFLIIDDGVRQYKERVLIQNE
jgi:predicted esterase